MIAKTSVRIVLMLAFVLTLSACQSDENIYDSVAGRTWVGDLGFVDEIYDEALESGITLNPDGFGVDEQYYYSDGKHAYTLNIRWWVEHGTIFLDYGNNYSLLEIRNAYVSRNFLRGSLYVAGYYDGEVELEMF